VCRLHLYILWSCVCVDSAWWASGFHGRASGKLKSKNQRINDVLVWCKHVVECFRFFSLPFFPSFFALPPCCVGRASAHTHARPPPPPFFCASVFV
jgi:hypothetical protein